MDHDELRGFLETILRLYVQEKKLGKILGENFPLKLAQRQSREPDLTFVSTDRLAKLKKNYFDGAPNLIIEVLSPDSHYRDKIQKRAEYEHLGTDEYWIIDPANIAESIFLFRLNNHFEEKKFTDGVIKSNVLKDFFLKSDWIRSRENYPNLFEICRQLGIL